MAATWIFGLQRSFSLLNELRKHLGLFVCSCSLLRCLSQTGIPTNHYFFFGANRLTLFAWLDCRCGVLGMAFKPNNDDFRESLAFKLRRLLSWEGAEVFCTDVHLQREGFVSLSHLAQTGALFSPLFLQTKSEVLEGESLCRFFWMGFC